MTCVRNQSAGVQIVALHYSFSFHLGTAWSGGAARTCDAAGADRVMVSTDRNMHVAVSVGDRSRDRSSLAYRKALNK